MGIRETQHGLEQFAEGAPRTAETLHAVELFAEALTALVETQHTVEIFADVGATMVLREGLHALEVWGDPASGRRRRGAVLV